MHFQFFIVYNSDFEMNTYKEEILDFKDSVAQHVSISRDGRILVLNFSIIQMENSTRMPIYYIY